MTTVRALLFASALGCSLVASCGNDSAEEHKVGGYAKSCTLDSDCIFVNTGICACTCETDVINQKDLPKFEADTKGCGASCGACPQGNAEPFCNAGSCDARLKDAGLDGD